MKGGASVDRRREAGAGVLALLVLLVLVAGLGAWNYRRNLEREAGEYRPFRGYSDEELADLSEAYEQKKTTDTRRYEKAAARRVDAQTKGYFDEQVAEFERAQRVAGARKAAQGVLAESHTALELIEKEQRRRGQERDKLKLFLKRVLTI
jgi:hypothetical protein